MGKRKLPHSPSKDSEQKREQHPPVKRRRKGGEPPKGASGEKSTELPARLRVSGAGVLEWAPPIPKYRCWVAQSMGLPDARGAPLHAMLDRQQKTQGSAKACGAHEGADAEAATLEGDGVMVRIDEHHDIAEAGIQYRSEQQQMAFDSIGEQGLGIYESLPCFCLPCPEEGVPPMLLQQRVLSRAEWDTRMRMQFGEIADAIRAFVRPMSLKELQGDLHTFRFDRFRWCWRLFDAWVKEHASPEHFRHRLAIAKCLDDCIAIAYPVVNLEIRDEAISRMFPEYAIKGTTACEKLAAEAQQELTSEVSSALAAGSDVVSIMWHCSVAFEGKDTTKLKAWWQAAPGCTRRIYSQLLPIYLIHCETTMKDRVCTEIYNCVEKMEYPLDSNSDKFIFRHDGRILRQWMDGSIPEDVDSREEVVAAWVRVCKRSPTVQFWRQAQPATLWNWLNSPAQEVLILPQNGGISWTTAEASMDTVYHYVTIRARGAMNNAHHLNKLFPPTSGVDAKHMSFRLSDLVDEVVKGRWINKSKGPLSRRSAVAIMKEVFQNVRIGSPQTFVITVLIARLGCRDTDKFWEYVVRNQLLLLPIERLRPCFKLASNVMRRCFLLPDGAPLTGVEVAASAYWEMSTGRSLMLADVENEKANRTHAPAHFSVSQLDGGQLSWRDEPVAYPERDAAFYKQLETELTGIMQKLLPNSGMDESMHDFLMRRHEWTASGSAAGAKVIVEGRTFKANKRTLLESKSAAEWEGIIRAKPPEEFATFSNKFEPGKERALYGVEPLHYIISSYVTKGMEERIRLVDGGEKGLTGIEQLQAEHAKERLARDKWVHCAMIDYADFNIQHTVEAQVLMYRAMRNAARKRSVHPDWERYVQWMMQAKRNMVIDFSTAGSNQPSRLRATMGMFSGTRSTDLLNTTLNMSYFEVARKWVKKLFDLEPKALHHVHQGDDVWISNESIAWSVALYYVMNNMGCRFQKMKQLFGRECGEFLRVLYTRHGGRGFLARSLASFVLKQLQSQQDLDSVNVLKGLCSNIALLQRRGLSEQVAVMLHNIVTAYYGRIRAYPKDRNAMRIPPAILYAPSTSGGIGVSPPGTFATTEVHLPRFPVFGKSLPNEMRGIESCMSRDWISHVSEKLGSEYLIRAEVLRNACVSVNYASVIRDVAGIKLMKEYYVKWHNYIRNARDTRLLSRFTIHKIGTLEDAILTVNVNMQIPRNQIHSPPYCHASQLFNDITLRTLLDDGVVPHQRAVRLADSIARVVQQTAFKSIATTRTALGLNTAEALQFIIATSTTRTLDDMCAIETLATAAAHPQLEIEEVLTSQSYLHFGFLLAYIHPSVLQEVVGTAKSIVMSQRALGHFQSNRDIVDVCGHFTGEMLVKWLRAIRSGLLNVMY